MDSFGLHYNSVKVVEVVAVAELLLAPVMEVMGPILEVIVAKVRRDRSYHHINVT